MTTQAYITSNHRNLMNLRERKRERGREKGHNQIIGNRQRRKNIHVHAHERNCRNQERQSDRSNLPTSLARFH